MFATTLTPRWRFGLMCLLACLPFLAGCDQLNGLVDQAQKGADKVAQDVQTAKPVADPAAGVPVTPAPADTAAPSVIPALPNVPAFPSVPSAPALVKGDAEPLIKALLAKPSSAITNQDLAAIALLETGAERVTKLSLAGSKVDGSGLQHLARFNGLRELDLSSLGISGADFSVLAKLTALETLSLSYTGMDDTHLVAIKSLHNLKRLDLSRTSITDSGFDNLAELAKLESLSLGWTRIDGSGFPKLSHEHLREIDVISTPFGQNGPGYIKDWSKLEALGLQACGLSDSSLGQVAGLVNLRKLNISHNGISRNAFAALARLKKLEELNCRETGIDDTALLVLRGCGELKHVELGKTACTPANAVPFLKKISRKVEVTFTN